MSNFHEQRMATPRLAAGALFTDAYGQVLLVRPAYKPGWEIPGGYVERGESPLAACAREVREELGLVREFDRLLVHDWAPGEREGDKILYIFDGGRLTDEDLARVVLPADELSDHRFFGRDELGTVLVPRLARRVLAALDASRKDRPVYLEHGLVRALM